MDRRLRRPRAAERQGPAGFPPLAHRCLAGEVSINVDRTFALDDVGEALARVGEGRALGKVVVEPRSTRRPPSS